jgi:hypothetical protein
MSAFNVAIREGKKELLQDNNRCKKAPFISMIIACVRMTETLFSK